MKASDDCDPFWVFRKERPGDCALMRTLDSLRSRVFGPPQGLDRLIAWCRGGPVLSR